MRIPGIATLNAIGREWLNHRLSRTCVKAGLLVFLITNTYALTALDIAKQKDIPGKYVEGECHPYAIELNRRLNQAGFNSYLITYRWDDTFNHLHGYHAIVLFQYKGRWYIQDNQHFSPTWVEGKSDKEVICLFHKYQFLISEINIKVQL